MTGGTVPDEKQMRLRYDGICHLCGTVLPAGTHAVYERAARRVRCVSCRPAESRAPADVAPAWSAPFEQIQTASERTLESAEIDAGTAGASARREYERRRDSREQRIRSNHPKLGGLILALSDEPASTRSWERGAIGEEKLAARLERLPAPARSLHDRRIPRTRANIDHIVVADSGVWVIDAKRYKDKRPALHVEGGILRPRVETLRIGGRDGSKLVAGVHKQIALMTDALGDPGIPVLGALCFLDADWPMIGGSFAVDDIQVLWPRLLPKRIAGTPDAAIDVDAVHARIARAFPVA
ncbi:nuclease-related domain-containing protein [Microbacterium sp. NPDC089987]|uniref:nuclease-related domain-containing protein n=1 Tax=Microbacterium sp. NPDC089987 TaxID=3364202 RepID=UPI0038016BBE